MPFIKINKQNFFNNLDTIAQKTQRKNKIALVLKDNAYGHGLDIMAKLANEYGITKAVVQNDKEAQSIVPLFESVLVLADIPKQADEKIHYTINTIDDIPRFPKQTKVHLKVDTGMHRNGIDPSELEAAFAAIIKQDLQLTGIFSHHRSADELTSEWFWQKENFKKIKKASLELIRQFDLPLPAFHLSNSASLMRSSTFDEDMARVGIAAYGCMEVPKPLQNEELKPVLSLYANKIGSKQLPKGSRIGYGGAHTLKEDAIISTYDIGYGDGFLRCLSHSYTTPKGYRIAGRISMDNSSFYSEEEKLLIFDDARDVAKQAGTIAYEVLTSLKPDIPREVV